MVPNFIKHVTAEMRIIVKRKKKFNKIEEQFHSILLHSKAWNVRSLSITGELFRSGKRNRKYFQYIKIFYKVIARISVHLYCVFILVYI